MEMNEFLIRQMFEKNQFEKFIKPERYEEAIADAVAEFEDAIKYAIFEAVPSHRYDEFEALLEAEDDAKTQAFIASVVPDMEKVVRQAYERFNASYLPPL